VSVEEVSKDLAAYLAERSALNGVSLDDEFFARHLRDGVVGFFGVEIGFDNTGALVMVRDSQEPYEGCFDEWVKQAQDDGLDDVCIESREEEVEQASILH